MCAIVGFISVNNTPPKEALITFARLLYAGTCRGKDASGFMCPTPNGSAIRVSKAPGLPAAVLESLPTVAPRWMIGHNRQGTGGSPIDNENNHPVISGNFALVHNGTVRSQGYVHKGGTDKLPYPHAAEVDSQLLVETLDILVNDRNWKLPSAISKGIPRYTTGNYTGIAVDGSSPNTLHLFRDGNPLVLAFDPLLRIIWLASTKEIILSACGKTVRHLDGLFVERIPPADGSLLFSELSTNDYLTITVGDNDISWMEDKLESPTYSTTTVQGNCGTPSYVPPVTAGGNKVAGRPHHNKHAHDPINRPFPMRYSSPGEKPATGTPAGTSPVPFTYSGDEAGYSSDYGED